MAISSLLSQAQRNKVIEQFKAENHLNILVATDVAARGLDISDLPLVINYEISTAPEDYVHRIGRTGRAGAKGIAISLIDEEETKYFDEIEKLIKKQIPKEKGAVSHRPARPAKGAKTEEAWFYQPYEPTSAAVAPKPVAAKATSAKRKVVAALLGGFGFKASPQPRNQAKRGSGRSRQKAESKEVETVENASTES